MLPEKQTKKDFVENEGTKAKERPKSNLR